MLAMVLTQWSDVHTARECAVALARTAGLSAPEMVATAVGEIANNCLEHQEGAGLAILKIGCGRGRVIVQAENSCRQRPTWLTAKPELMEEFRAGGYGLLLVRALAQKVECIWHGGRARVRAEFVSPAEGGSTPTTERAR